MSLWVACNVCHASFEAETHAGLIRCAPCADTKAYRLTPTAPRIVQVTA